LRIQSELFPELTPSDLRLIAEHGVLATFPKNTVLIEEGERSSFFYIIESGRVKVYVSSEGKKEIILNTQGPGEYFGELAIIDDTVRSASVMTLEESKIWMVAKQRFLECLESHPSLAAEIVRTLTRRVRALTHSVKSLALLDVYGRVARLLLQLAVEQGGVLVIDRKLTHREIANNVGASREMVSRIMKDLVTGGYVRVEPNRITILTRLPDAW
jgi:CRP/FNR family cyclic AMP-dependent transcriptional regulator